MVLFAITPPCTVLLAIVRVALNTVPLYIAMGIYTAPSCDQEAMVNDCVDLKVHRFPGLECGFRLASRNVHRVLCRCFPYTLCWCFGTYRVWQPCLTRISPAHRLGVLSAAYINLIQLGSHWSKVGHCTDNKKCTRRRVYNTNCILSASPVTIILHVWLSVAMAHAHWQATSPPLAMGTELSLKDIIIIIYVAFFAFNVDGVYVIGLRFTSCLPGASHVTSTPAEKFNRISLTVTFLVGPLAITTNTSKNMESIDISHHRHNSIVDEPKPRARVSYGTLHPPPATVHLPHIIIITNRVWGKIQPKVEDFLKSTCSATESNKQYVLKTQAPGPKQTNSYYKRHNTLQFELVGNGSTSFWLTWHIREHGRTDGRHRGDMIVGIGCRCVRQCDVSIDHLSKRNAMI